MRSIKAGAIIEASNSPLACPGSLMRTPSSNTSVCPAFAPRSLMDVVPPGPPVSVVSSPGTDRRASTSDAGLVRWISSARTTVTALPVRWIEVGSRLAVTVTSRGLVVSIGLPSGNPSSGRTCADAMDGFRITDRDAARAAWRIRFIFDLPRPAAKV